MKPLGWKNLYQHANYEDKMPKKSIKRFKRGDKQKVKKAIKKEISK